MEPPNKTVSSKGEEKKSNHSGKYDIIDWSKAPCWPKMVQMTFFKPLDEISRIIKDSPGHLF